MKNNQPRAKAGGELAGPYGEIPKKLREYYDQLQEEQIPDRFLDLLEKLDEAERAAAARSAVKEFE